MTMPDSTSGVAPVTPDEPIEWRIALSGVWITLALGALFVAGGQWFMGFEGLLSTGMAVAIVVGMQLLTGAMMSVAARFGPTALMAAALAGYVFKLAIYALLIVLLRARQRTLRTESWCRSGLGVTALHVVEGLVLMPRRGLLRARVDGDWFQVFLGGMVIAAVIFNNFIRKRAQKA
jgi:hypothetical protein